MEKQEYLFMPNENDQEFTEADGKIAAEYPEYAAVSEDKRRVAYFLTAYIRAEKMPAIAAKAGITLSKCYELVRDPECRTAQHAASKWLVEREKIRMKDSINNITLKIARIARNGHLKGDKFTAEMLQLSRAADPQYALTPYEFYYIGINQLEYLAARVPMVDEECIRKVQDQLKEAESCSRKAS